MSNENKIPNLLIKETSPYLLQHAYNPVKWHAWNEQTLQKAKAYDKLLIISIGYAACHWCHVMEHECFENDDVAKVMNENFLCIKVDREERPDVDDVYMTACQLVNQRGCGWPLNAFALPDGKPIWATTYHPKDNWIHLLNQIIKTQQVEPDRLTKSANDLTNGLKNYDNIFSQQIVNVEQHLIHTIMLDFMSVMDFENGGRKGAPKFPMPNTLECLMKYFVFSKEQRIWKIVEITLDKMANGGIYDQLQGGFARYSVDDIWMVPHFEKMLYDNGQLLYNYSLAYRKTKKPLYKKIIDETIKFMSEEWLNDDGVFYSALDADSEGEEGKYYTWTNEELQMLITEETHRKVFYEYFSIEEHGNFEETNVLHCNDKVDLLVKYNLTQEDFENIIQDCKTILLKTRSTKIKPSLDNKILTSWNALTIKGLAQAYIATQNEFYIKLAKNCLVTLIKNHSTPNGKLYRNNKNSTSPINGFLEDYATMIDAFLQMYEVDFDEFNIDKATQYCEYIFSHFETPDQIMFYYTSDEDAPLAVRKIESSDNVISASNSILARCLFRLGVITGNEKYKSRAEKMVNSIMNYISEIRAAHFYANWCSAFIEQKCSQGELVITGDKVQELNKELQSHFHLNLLLAGSKKQSELAIFQDKNIEGQALLYLCQDGFCRMPTENFNEITSILTER